MPLGDSRRHANEIKRQEKITVVVGNPPYKEKAKGLGRLDRERHNGREGQESQEGYARHSAIGCRLPTGTSAPTPSTCAISMSISGGGRHGRSFGDGNPSRIEGRKRATGRASSHSSQLLDFLNGPGFQKMRAELRRDADEIWVIDCSPEGTPTGGTDANLSGRTATGVHRYGATEHGFRFVLPQRGSDTVLCRSGHRDDKFAALGADGTLDDRWVDRVLFRFPRLILP